MNEPEPEAAESEPEPAAVAPGSVMGRHRIQWCVESLKIFIIIKVAALNDTFFDFIRSCFNPEDEIVFKHDLTTALGQLGSTDSEEVIGTIHARIMEIKTNTEVDELTRAIYKFNSNLKKNTELLDKLAQAAVVVEEMMPLWVELYKKLEKLTEEALGDLGPDFVDPEDDDAVRASAFKILEGDIESLVTPGMDMRALLNVWWNIMTIPIDMVGKFYKVVDLFGRSMLSGVASKALFMKDLRKQLEEVNERIDLTIEMIKQGDDDEVINTHLELRDDQQKITAKMKAADKSPPSMGESIGAAIIPAFFAGLVAFGAYAAMQGGGKYRKSRRQRARPTKRRARSLAKKRASQRKRRATKMKKKMKKKKSRKGRR